MVVLSIQLQILWYPCPQGSRLTNRHFAEVVSGSGRLDLHLGNLLLEPQQLGGDTGVCWVLPLEQPGILQCTVCDEGKGWPLPVFGMHGDAVGTNILVHALNTTHPSVVGLHLALLIHVHLPGFRDHSPWLTTMADQNGRPP